MLTCITIPTYNEIENIGDLLTEIRSTVPEADILVVDDDSPDGTAGAVRALMESDEKIHLLVRTTERGRGTAGRDAFIWALQQGADYIVEMDADFSHHPRYLPAIFAASREADVVLGSRYVRGGCETGRPVYRQVLTKLVGTLLRVALSVPVRDPSSGYRCFRRNVLETIQIDQLISTGPSIVSELLYKSQKGGFKIVEVPIVFHDRTRGTSKLNFLTLLNTLKMVFHIRRDFARRPLSVSSRPAS